MLYNYVVCSHSAGAVCVVLPLIVIENDESDEKRTVLQKQQQNDLQRNTIKKNKRKRNNKAKVNDECCMTRATRNTITESDGKTRRLVRARFGQFNISVLEKWNKQTLLN